MTPTPPGVPADVAPYVHGYLTLVDVLVGVSAVLGVALVGTLWLLVTRLRRRHAWQVAYWHLLATATCPLCGSRLEAAPPDLPTGAVRLPVREPHRGEL